MLLSAFPKSRPPRRSWLTCQEIFNLLSLLVSSSLPFIAWSFCSSPSIFWPLFPSEKTVIDPGTVGFTMVYNATAERLLQEPALEPPPGVERHMGARSPAAYYVCAVFCSVVPGTLLCLRLYTKTHILKRTDLTDCLQPHSKTLSCGCWHPVDLTVLAYVINKCWWKVLDCSLMNLFSSCLLGCWSLGDSVSAQVEQHINGIWPYKRRMMSCSYGPPVEISWWKRQADMAAVGVGGWDRVQPGNIDRQERHPTPVHPDLCAHQNCRSGALHRFLDLDRSHRQLEFRLLLGQHLHLLARAEILGYADYGRQLY